jgi:putative Mg2+ transporter-C (MgtC) family protein
MGLEELLALLQTDLLGKLFLAAVLGGAIGLERELNGKTAGLRTNLMIAIGATLLMHLSIHLPEITGTTHNADPGRIAAQIVSGIGWLGAGTILQARGNVTGLTTAATLWVVAGIGMATGAGALAPAIGATAFVLFVLYPVGWWERHYGPRRRSDAAREERPRRAVKGARGRSRKPARAH